MNPSCIVCAIDRADTSPAVLASAMALAAWDNAELHVLHLADPTSESTPPAPSFVARASKTTIIRSGDPATAIVDHARRVRADLIVAGATLAAPGIDRLGWLAEVIARDAHCPTLIVPLAAPHKREELPYRNILCPIDFSPGSVIAYERALTLTQDAGGTLTLLHVVDDVRDDKGLVRILRDDERQLRIAEARVRLGMAISEESLNWCHVGVHVTAGAAGVHILAEARRLGADLIVMGLTPRVGAVPTRVGSMPGRVAAQAACPVLVLRATAGSSGWDDVYDARERHDALPSEAVLHALEERGSEMRDHGGEMEAVRRVSTQFGGDRLSEGSA
jgi:nucleotide-binding universal stress UspA family protein